MSTSTSTNVSSSSEDSACSSPLQYPAAGGVCSTEFADLLISADCAFDRKGTVLVVKNEEAMVMQLVNGLTTLQSSNECKSKAIPLICLHLFGLCGESGVPIRPTRSECEEVRDETCQREWNIVKALDFDLPDCAILPDEASFCSALNDSGSTNGTVMGMSKKIDTYPCALFPYLFLPFNITI